MQELNKNIPVEKITLPPRYRTDASTHSLRLLCILYEDLKRDHLQTLQQEEEAQREAWSWERMASSLQDRLDIAHDEIRRLAEAGRYAVYGKPKPEDLSPVDEEDEGEQDSGEATH